MKMDSTIRVKTERKYRALYRDLTNLAVTESHELFFICACLGYQRRHPVPLGKRGDDRFWSSTFTPEEWTAFYAMLLQENNMDFGTVQDEKQVIARIEEYANGGMEILLAECLDGYVSVSDDDILLDGTASRELPKTMLHYVFERAISGGQTP